jgi:hypothetical protein
MINIKNDRNTKTLTFLENENEGYPIFLPVSECSADNYYDLGCHPDVVKRLWDEINPKLPANCRTIIYGTPALIQQDNG